MGKQKASRRITTQAVIFIGQWRWKQIAWRSDLMSILRSLNQKKKEINQSKSNIAASGKKAFTYCRELIERERFGRNPFKISHKLVKGGE